MYCKIYAPNGEAFEVSRERADRLVLQEGWTQTKPEFVPTEPVVEVVATLKFVAPKKAKKKTRKRGSSAFADILADEWADAE